MHGIGGRIVKKIQKFDLKVISRLDPNIVIVKIGTNNLSPLRPVTLGNGLTTW